MNALVVALGLAGPRLRATRWPRTTIAAATVLLLLSACGPSEFEKEKLAFEKQKYKDEQAAKVEAARLEEQDKQQQKSRWMACRVASDEEYNAEFELWGEPVPGKPGRRNGPTKQLEDMEQRLQRKKEQCDRNFPKGISW